MIDIELKQRTELNYQKINGFLNSFSVDNVQNTDLPDSKSKENATSSSVKILSSPNLSSILALRKIENKSHSKAKTLPTNYDCFKIRLMTFEYGLWTCTQISPIICASYGWKMSDKDILSCVTCNAVICSSLPLPNKIEAYANFTNILKKRLRSGHKEWCGWSSNPSPPEFLHPPIKATVHFFRKLFEDAKKLCSINECLPYFDIKEIFRKLEVDEKLISQFYGQQTELSKIELTAALLVLCGWMFETNETLKCNYCIRQIGLWNFVSLSKEEEYLRLRKRNEENEAKRLRNETRRIEREKRARVKEEEERTALDKKRQALEEQEKAEEAALKVKLALEKISQMENMRTESEFESNEENDELSEEEENMLLSEDLADVEKDESTSGKETDDIPEEDSGMQHESDEFKKTNQYSVDMSDSDQFSEGSQKSSKESSLKDERDHSDQENSTEDEQHCNKTYDSEEEERERDQESSQHDSDENEEVNNTLEQNDSPQEDSEEEADIDSSQPQDSSLHEDSEDEEIVEASHQEEGSLHEDYDNEEEIVEASQEQEESLHEDSENEIVEASQQQEETFHEDSEDEELVEASQQEEESLHEDSEDEEEIVAASHQEASLHKDSVDNEEEIVDASQPQEESFYEDSENEEEIVDASQPQEESLHEDSENEEEIVDASQPQEESLHEDSENEEEIVDASQPQEESLHEDSENEEEIVNASQLQSSEEEEEGIESSPVHQEIHDEPEEGEEVDTSQFRESPYEDPEEVESMNTMQNGQFLYEDNEDVVNGSEDELWLEAVGGVPEDNENSVPSTSESSESDGQYRPRSIKRRRCSESSDTDYSDSRTASKYPRLEEDLEELIKEQLTSSIDESNMDVDEAMEVEEDVSDDEKEEESTEDDATYERMKNSLFDPLEQHRHWCGCLVDHSSLYIEKTMEPIPGYKIIPPQLKSLIPEQQDTNLFLTEKYATNLQCYRTVRDMLDSWSRAENSEEIEFEDEEMEVI